MIIRCSIEKVPRMCVHLIYNGIPGSPQKRRCLEQHRLFFINLLSGSPSFTNLEKKPVVYSSYHHMQFYKPFQIVVRKHHAFHLPYNESKQVVPQRAIDTN